MNKKTTGERIKDLRKHTIIDVNGKHKSMTQALLADRIGVDLKTVRSWEKDITLPDFRALSIMCDTFHCDADYLLLKIDYPTHALTDVKKETGLSEKAIQILSMTLSGQQYEAGYSYNEWSEFGKNCLSWFIENGLFQECVAQGNYAREWAVVHCTLDGFPEYFRKIVDAVVTNNDFDNIETAFVAALTFTTSDALTDLVEHAHEYIINYRSYIFDDDEEKYGQGVYNKVLSNRFINSRFEVITDEAKHLIERVFIRYYPFVMLLSRLNDKPVIEEFRDWHNSRWYADLLKKYREHLLDEERE